MFRQLRIMDKSPKAPKLSKNNRSSRETAKFNKLTKLTQHAIAISCKEFSITLIYDHNP